MKKLFLDNLKILLPSILSLIISSLMWDKINFEYNNPNQIIGYYSIFKHSALNDNIRYILFSDWNYRFSDVNGDYHQPSDKNHFNFVTKKSV